MDCVSCEKCRLWGKLQILGIGTAIKILLTPNNQLLAQDSKGRRLLNRQEVIALINVLHQFSKSIEFIAYVEKNHPVETVTEEYIPPPATGGYGVARTTPLDSSSGQSIKSYYL